MKAILVDAKNQTVTEVDVPTKGTGEDLMHELQSMYDLIGCTCITGAFELPNGDMMYVDDEGLLTNPEHFFLCNGWYPAPLAGNGLLCGSGSVGESAPVITTVDQVVKRTVFMNPETAALYAKMGGL